MEHKILICECSNTEHQLVFSSFEDESTVYVSIHLSKHGFFERLKYAIKYIFGHQCNYGAFQEILLSKKHIPQLKEIIEKLDSRTINIEKLKEKVANRPKEWREGQAYFNYLEEMDGELANIVRGTGNDPFYVDSKIPRFLKWLES